MQNNQENAFTLKAELVQKEISWISEIKKLSQDELNAIDLKRITVGKKLIIEAYKANDESRIKHYEHRLEELTKEIGK